MPSLAEIKAAAEVPHGCTCGYPVFPGYSTRYHTYDCQIRTGMNLGHALHFVEIEVEKAKGRFQDFHSPHEGWAVIKEELDELWAHVKADTGHSVEARTEAIQVAAMALRYILDCCEKST